MTEATAPENETAPTAEARKPRKVRATWIVARNRDGSSRSRSAARAPRLPSLDSCASRCHLTVIRANSEAAKKPLHTMSAATISRSRNGLPVALPPPPASGIGWACLAALMGVPLRGPSRAAAPELDRACRHADHRAARRHVPRHHRSRPGPSAGTDGDRSPQQRVDAYEGPVADHGAVLG